MPELLMDDREEDQLLIQLELEPSELLEEELLEDPLSSRSRRVSRASSWSRINSSYRASTVASWARLATPAGSKEPGIVSGPFMMPLVLAHVTLLYAQWDGGTSRKSAENCSKKGFERSTGRP